MHAIKEINFARDHPGEPFPSYESLSPAAARRLRDRIGARCGLRPDDDALVFAHTLAARESPVVGTGNDAQAPSFDVLEMIGRLGIAPDEHVYINWGDFREVDRFATRDFAKYFPYLWYPGPDAIDVCDESCQWVLSIDPDGHVDYVLFAELGK